MIIHVVKAGDQLYDLAQRYQVDLNQLIAVNELPDPNRLVIGLALLIPIKGTWHTVLAGESMWSIAGNYRIPLNSILNANPNIDPTALMPGMKIYVPLQSH